MQLEMKNSVLVFCIIWFQNHRDNFLNTWGRLSVDCMSGNWTWYSDHIYASLRRTEKHIY